MNAPPLSLAGSSLSITMAENAFSRSELEAQKADELRQLCRQHNLKVSGTKAELIDRLVRAGPCMHAFFVI